MPKRSSKREDANQAAFRTLQEATGERPKTPATPAPETTDKKNPAAVALGKLGGRKGGPARAAALSKKQLSAIARKAARARWSNAKGE